jgi:hypothetical protein
MDFAEMEIKKYTLVWFTVRWSKKIFSCVGNYEVIGSFMGWFVKGRIGWRMYEKGSSSWPLVITCLSCSWWNGLRPRAWMAGRQGEGLNMCKVCTPLASALHYTSCSFRYYYGSVHCLFSIVVYKQWTGTDIFFLVPEWRATWFPCSLLFSLCFLTLSTSSCVTSLPVSHIFLEVWLALVLIITGLLLFHRLFS